VRTATAAAAVAADRVTMRSALVMSFTVGRSAGFSLDAPCDLVREHDPARPRLLLG